MSIETHRRQFVNNIQSEITRLEKSISRDEDVLKNIKNLNLSQDILKFKQEELQNNIKRKNDDIQKLKISGDDVASGNRDKEIVKKNVITKKVLKPKVKKTPPKKYIPMKFQASNRDFDYHYNRMLKITETIPDYMKRNLEEMPNNKGYIWKDCWFFGKLPSHRNENIVLFEKQRNSMKIHEIDKENYSIFEKVGQNRKNLIYCKPKKQFFKSLI
jgi:hypothetical protein